MLKVAVDAVAHLSFLSFLRPRYRRELKAKGRSYQSGRDQRLFQGVARPLSYCRSERPSEEDSYRVHPLLWSELPQVTP